MSTLFNSINFAKLAEMRPDALRNLVKSVENIKAPAQHEAAHTNAQVATESFSAPTNVTFDKTTRTLITAEGVKLKFGSEVKVETSDGKEFELPKHLATFATNVHAASKGNIDWHGWEEVGRRVDATTRPPAFKPNGNARG